jgi:SOS-response transcriptional repressor LexA
MKTEELSRLVGAKIRNLRLQKGLSLRDLAHLAALDPGYLSNLERGKQRMNLEIMATLARALEVEPSLLLPAPRKKILQNDSAQAILPLTQSVPLISKVAAGDPKEYTDGDYPPGFADRFIPIPLGTIRDPQAFALEVEGDSMEPRFPKGTFVICSPMTELLNGKAAVVKMDEGEVACKIFYKRANLITLTSVNEKYEPIVVEIKRVLWAYPVVKSIRTEE